MGRKMLYSLLGLATLALISTGCQKSSEDVAAVTPPKSLYVSSGLCTSGVGVTTYTAATASRVVTKWGTDEGTFESVVIDWNVASGFAASLPQDVIDEGESLLILAENAGTMTERKVFRIEKANLGIYETVVPQAYSATPVTAATHIHRHLRKDDKGQFTVVRSASIERINALGSLIPGPTAVGTSYIYMNAATAPCQTAAQLTTGTVTPAGTYVGLSDAHNLDPAFGSSNGKIIFSVMGSAAANNRLGASIPAGINSATVAHCAGGVQITAVPHTLATNLGTAPVTFDANGVSPTSMVLIKTPAPATTTAKLIVSYGPSNNAVTAQHNTTNLNHAIVVWNVTETSATAVTFDSPVVLANDDTVIIAPSAMAYDEEDGSLYVAVGPSPKNVTQAGTNQGYNIEKFTLDLTTPSLTRVHNNFQPFIVGNAQTKCISGLTIGN